MKVIKVQDYCENCGHIDEGNLKLLFGMFSSELPTKNIIMCEKCRVELINLLQSDQNWNEWKSINKK